jgi:hypothetical protein
MTSAGPEPGWYFDEDSTDVERYWNGTEWTGHRRERRSAAPDVENPAPDPGVKPDANNDDGDEQSPAQSEAAPTPDAAGLAKGDWAKVIGGIPHHVGRVGRVVAVTPETIGITFYGAGGMVTFERDHVQANATGPQTLARSRPASVQSAPPETYSKPDLTASSDPNPAKSPKSGVGGFWSQLSAAGKIGVVATVVVPVLLIAVVFNAVSNNNSTSRNSDGGYTPITTSWSAGFQQGQALQRSARANGGTRLSDAEANEACDLFLEHVAESGGVKWTGGYISTTSLDTNEYHDGCFAGIKS